MKLVSFTMLASALTFAGLTTNTYAQAYDKQALAGWFIGISPEKVFYAINCGSEEELTDVVGITYRPVFACFLNIYIG